MEDMNIYKSSSISYFFACPPSILSMSHNAIFYHVPVVAVTERLDLSLHHFLLMIVPRIGVFQHFLLEIFVVFHHTLPSRISALLLSVVNCILFIFLFLRLFLYYFYQFEICVGFFHWVFDLKYVFVSSCLVRLGIEVYFFRGFCNI